MIQLAFIYWVPESPRWLIFKNKHEKALEMLAYYHGGGDISNPTVQYEYREISETIHIEKMMHKQSSYMDFFKTTGNRWRLAILVSLGIISQYSGNALLSNYINLIYEGAGVTSQTQKLAVSLQSFSHARHRDRFHCADT